jgi:putative addiction module component (TIGR02574 family)
MSVQEIREEALKLPPEERERLAQDLWESVDDEPEDEELKAILDRRWEEIVSGEVKTLSLTEVVEDTRKRLEERERDLHHRGASRQPQTRILETEDFR